MNQAVQIRDSLQRLNKLFSMIAIKEFEQVGITSPQIMVLRCILYEPKTIGQISNAVHLSYSTVSGIIDRLEREGFVQRTRDLDDRRVVWINKTEKFEEIKKQVPFFQEEYYAQMFQDLSEEEVNNIVSSLRLLITQLEKKVEEKQ